MFLKTIVLVALGIVLIYYFIGPIERNEDQISYEDALESYKKGFLGLEPLNKRIAKIIAESLLFPKDKQKSYQSRGQILRILYCLSLGAIWLAWPRAYTYGEEAIIQKNVLLGGIILFLGALAFRSYSYGKLTKDIVTEAMNNQNLYDAVATLGGWRCLSHLKNTSNTPQQPSS